MKNPKSKIQNPKSQIPNPKKIPNLKLQAEALGNGAFQSWDEPAPGNGPLMLREDVATPARPHPYDLEERTAQFGEAIIGFVKKIPRNPANDRLIGQLAGCGTSVGANYREANEPVSKKDFLHCIGRCLKEAKETQFFLRMVATSEPQLAEEARVLYRETKELVLIFSSMRRK